MARKRDRAFAAFGAVLFLLTSSALTIAVVVTMFQQKQSNNTTNTAAKQTNNQPKITGTKMQGFTPTTQPLTKLQIIDTKVGSGAAVKAGDTITAVYEGALMNTGVVFDAAMDHGGPQTFSLSGVIAGWSQGIPGMKVGGTRRLLIPAGLAYGSQGSGSIPPNSDLVFDVTVLKTGK